MPKYSAAVERWRPVVAKYFPPELVDKALWVIQHESGGNPTITGDNGVAIGLFQVQDNTRFEGRPSKQWLSNPENNIKYAAQQLGAAGGNWGAWGEGTTYQGKPFGALGHNPYPGDQANPTIQSANYNITPPNTGGGGLRADFDDDIQRAIEESRGRTRAGNPIVQLYAGGPVATAGGAGLSQTSRASLSRGDSSSSFKPTMGPPNITDPQYQLPAEIGGGVDYTRWAADYGAYFDAKMFEREYNLGPSSQYVDDLITQLSMEIERGNLQVRTASEMLSTRLAATSQAYDLINSDAFKYGTPAGSEFKSGRAPGDYFVDTLGLSPEKSNGVALNPMQEAMAVYQQAQAMYGDVNIPEVPNIPQARTGAQTYNEVQQAMEKARQMMAGMGVNI